MRRWYRTLPNFLLAFILSVVVYFFVKNANQTPNITLMASTMIFVQNYLPPFQDFSFFSEAWSLAIEENFYLTFTILLFLFWKLGVRSPILYSIFVLTSIAFLSRLVIAKLYPIYNYDLYNTYIRVITPCRFDSMAIGVFFAYVKSSFPAFYGNKRNQRLMFFLGLLFCIAFDRTWMGEITYTPWVVLFYPILFSLGIGLVIPFVESISIGSRFAVNGISYISKVSYSLYLYHNFIFAQPLIRYTQGAESWIKVVCYLLFWALVLLVSLFAYTFVEKPFLRIRDKKYPEKQFIINNLNQNQ